MKCTVSREHLSKAAQMAERITGKKESLPILSCILLEAKQNGLIVRATNLEAGIQLNVPATIEGQGIVAVPANILSQILRSIRDDTISLKLTDGNLSIESKHSKNLIKATPHDEFPQFEHDTKGKKASLARNNFLLALQAVVYAASPSMIRPELGSVYLSLDKGTLLTVATDSFRLGEKQLVGLDKKTSLECLIPLKHVGEIIYLLERMEGDQIELSADEAQCSVNAEGMRFVCRLVEGQFPNYKEIIPKKFTTEATLLKSDLIELLRKARVFSGNDQHVGFHIYPKRKIFSATARSPEVGEMSDSLDAAVSGEDIDINFHIGYLADCLSSIAADSVHLGFAGLGKPLVVRGAGENSFLYLVMPLNR